MNSLQMLQLISAFLIFMVQCGKKKKPVEKKPKKAKRKRDKTEAEDGSDGDGENDNDTKNEENDKKGTPQNAPYEPNYMTFSGLDKKVDPFKQETPQDAGPAAFPDPFNGADQFAMLPTPAPPLPTPSPLATNPEATVNEFDNDIFGPDRKSGYEPVAGAKNEEMLTLNVGVNNSIFGVDKSEPASKEEIVKNKPIQPADKNIRAKPNDPNYMTLAAVQGDVFGTDKKKEAAQPAGEKKPIQPMNKNIKAKVNDPNYMTLAAVQGDVFGADKKNGASRDPSPDVKKPIQPANKAAKAKVNDPNYMTLAAVKGDVFGNDKKQTAPGAVAVQPAKKPVQPANKAVKAKTNDPNYMTLAAVQGDVFGVDKKKK